MCNCGNKRMAFTGRAPATRQAPPDKPIAPKMWPDIHFEYTGNTALNITGNVTGKQYRFARKGDLQPVDYRDARGMLHVAVLKKH